MFANEQKRLKREGTGRAERGQRALETSKFELDKRAEEQARCDAGKAGCVQGGGCFERCAASKSSGSPRSTVHCKGFMFQCAY